MSSRLWDELGIDLKTAPDFFHVEKVLYKAHVLDFVLANVLNSKQPTATVW